MYKAYIDGNTIDEIVAAGEDFVYSDIYPQVDSVIGREKLYEALAGASEGFAQEEVMIRLSGDPFVDNVVLGWIEGMRGCNVSIFSSDTDAKDWMADIRNSAKAEGIIPGEE
jgi:hypothetical protein